jgi:alpha-glucosidase
MTKFICLLLTLLASGVVWAQTASIRLQSPDGRLAIKFQTLSNRKPSATGGRLVYSVTFRGKPLVETSGLSLKLEGQPPLGPNVRIADVSRSETDDTYRLVTGKASVVHDHFNALGIALEENGGAGRKLEMEARAYNDAIAFRYVVPQQSGLSDFKLAAEDTEFRLAKDPFVYGLVLPDFRSMYESEYIHVPASGFANQGGVNSHVLLGLPLLMEVPGVAWMAITEADLHNYAAMYLVNSSGGWSARGFESRLAPQVDNPSLCVTGTLPHHSAWRVLMVGDEPGRLIESTVITSLNPPSKIKDTAWIHAGKAAWDWWSGNIGPDGKSAFTTDTMKYYVDFAAQSGFRYMLIDAGWSGRDITRMNGRVDVPAVVRYAAAKRVKVWIWISYSQANREMDQAFPLYEKWGVAGVKIDFVERDDQAGIAFYYRAAKTAARYHLMVDFHGCTKPTGIDRTYPNVMGYEAVLGLEQSKAGSRDNPHHRLVVPFTRMLAGRMDYTPGGFDNVTKAAFVAQGTKPMVMGTRAQQLAMYVVYESPFQMVSDCPQNYAGQPSFQFIRDVPATWDETKVLNGVPGRYITVARRHGADWYLGSMCSWEPRELDLPLTFLGKGRYEAEIYADAQDANIAPKHVVIERREVTRQTHLTAKLASAGGYAVRLVPLPTRR